MSVRLTDELGIFFERRRVIAKQRIGPNVPWTREEVRL